MPISLRFWYCRIISLSNFWWNSFLQSCLELEMGLSNKPQRSGLHTHTRLKQAVYNDPFKRMHFLCSHDTMLLFLHDIMTCMHILKKHNENHSGRTILIIRKHAKKPTTPHKLRPKTLDSTASIDFTHFLGHSESILCLILKIKSWQC